MILLLMIAAAGVSLVVMLVTCVQILYLESLRIKARELPALQFFKETLEPKIGLETERGAFTFSIVKHIGLTFMGCLILAITIESSPIYEALLEAFLLAGMATVLGAYLIPQIVYRKTSGHGLIALVPLLRTLALVARPSNRCST
jgi:putative hemolysin